MARIYKRSDRIPVKIGDITVKLAPLEIDQKTEIQHMLVSGRAKGDIKMLTNGVVLAMKYSVKAIEGVEDADGNPYKLDFDENKNLTDECISELMNLEAHSKLTIICANLVNGIPSEFTDESGQPIEGVEIVKAASGNEASPKNVQT